MAHKELSSLQGYKLYRHTSPSGKVYIGITKTSVYARWMNGRGYRRHCYAFYNAVLKYGWNNIKHEVLFVNLSKDRAIRLEIELIRHYKSLRISYNISDGGNLSSSTECSRRSSSENLKRLWKERPNELLKRKTRKGQKNTLSMIRKKSKPVIQFSLDGKYITEYLSTSEASSATGANIKGIRNCCNGGYFCKTKNRFINIHKAGGYIWKYKEDLLCQ